MNMWIEQYLRHWVHQQGQDNWTQFLPLAEFAHNSWPHDVTKKTPHKLLMGTKPQIHVEPMSDSDSPRATNQLITLQEARLHAAEALLKHYKTRTPPTQYAVGQQIWLEGKNL